jgi:hypothetical protein
LDIWLKIAITIVTMAIVEPFQSNCPNEGEDSKSTLMKLARLIFSLRLYQLASSLSWLVVG